MGDMRRDVAGAAAAGHAVPDPPLRGGELNAAITSAIVGIHTDFLGRGPKSASTFHHGPHVVTVLREVLTRAEQALAEGPHADDVRAMRLLKRDTMAPHFRAAVERLTGRRVIASIGGHDGKPDVAVEVFILDRPL